jgi:hypothetical protein
MPAESRLEDLIALSYDLIVVKPFIELSAPQSLPFADVDQVEGITSKWLASILAIS